MAAYGKRGRTEAENRRRGECELEENKEERLGKNGLLRRVIAEEDEEEAVSAAIAIRPEKVELTEHRDVLA